MHFGKKKDGQFYPKQSKGHGITSDFEEPKRKYRISGLNGGQPTWLTKSEREKINNIHTGDSKNDYENRRKAEINHALGLGDDEDFYSPEVQYMIRQNTLYWNNDDFGNHKKRAIESREPYVFIDGEKYGVVHPNDEDYGRR